MLKLISILSVLAFTACSSADKNEGSNVEGGITSGGMPQACVPGIVIGHTYQDTRKSMTIDFISKDQATFAVRGDDQHYVVSYDLTMNCNLTLKDSVAPSLGGKGRLFWLRVDGSRLFDSVTRAELKKIK